jgi:hypothetical protein
MLDSNAKSIRAQNDAKIHSLKIEGSSDIPVDGVLVRDPIIYRSDQATIRDHRMINRCPTTTT